MRHSEGDADENGDDSVNANDKADDNDNTDAVDDDDTDHDNDYGNALCALVLIDVIFSVQVFARCASYMR